MRVGKKTRQDKARPGEARQGKARQGKVRQGKTRRDKTRRDKTRQDRTGQDSTRQDKTRQHNTTKGRDQGSFAPGQCIARKWQVRHVENLSVGPIRVSYSPPGKGWFIASNAT